MIRIISNSAYFTTGVTNYTRRGKHRPPFSLKVGDQLSNFEVIGTKYYRDFDMTHLTLKHQQLATEIHQLECAQQNNTLSMVFKTKGSAKPALNYALEKLLQCGSKKYPVRNLPAEMSMKSFSQLTPTQTTDDYLMFSFNSPILRDFSNLFTVYTSMIFDPLMREQDFYEVVRRFTYEKERLGYTGELSAEMMENQFNIDQTIYTLITEELLGLASHSICKPLDLVNINYADLLQYYKQTITLPNCTFLLHGDMNIRYFIDELNKNIEQFKPNTQVPTFFEKPPRSVSFPKSINFDHLKQETILILSYRIDKPTEEQNTLLQILSYLLFDMPGSPLMKFNTIQTPYPNLYGYHQRYFNIGISFYQPNYAEQKHLQTATTFKLRQKLFMQKQSEMMTLLTNLSKSKFDDKLIQKCLIHLQNNYYQKRGFSIIESITERVLNQHSLDSVFEVSPLISKLLKSFRKENIFEKLLQKFIINNTNYIVLRGFNNAKMIEEEQSRNRSLLLQMQSTLSPQKLHQIAGYTPPSYLQDISRLPETSPNQLQFFQDLRGEHIQIKNVQTTYCPRNFGNRFTFKFDLTDIGQQDIPLLALFCKAFPRMGYKAVKEHAYQGLLETYISQLDMNYETIRTEEGKLKIYAFLNIQFSDRNYQFAFNVLNGLFTDFAYSNIFTLSKVIQQSATNCFHEVSQNILDYHGIHVAASKSPYAFFESPIFQARTLCGIAGDMKKVANPKAYLNALSSKFNQIWGKMMGWSRTTVLWQCHPEKKKTYQRYLQMLVSQIDNEGIPPESIDVTTFPNQKWLKYYPNYDQQMAFQAFSVPYRNQHSPATLVLASLINLNISTFNKIGGCFLYKGAMVSFIQGSRQKYLQLEDYYKKIDKIDIAKRRIFQHFDRYTVEQQFKSQISFQRARFFKEAVLAVQHKDLEEVLAEYILKSIKEGNSSMLALGPRLENYEPLLKKNWEIERSIDDVSLGMESLSRQEIQFKLEKYIDIC